jgi:hypothetical protein
LGSENPDHKPAFVEAIGDLLVVSAAGALPGSLPGVIGVDPDPECPRDVFRYHDGMFYASPYPRPIPGVSVDRNLHGASFAVANMTGLVARLLQNSSRLAIREALITHAENIVTRGSI